MPYSHLLEFNATSCQILRQVLGDRVPTTSLALTSLLAAAAVMRNPRDKPVLESGLSRSNAIKPAGVVLNRARLAASDKSCGTLGRRKQMSKR